MAAEGSEPRVVAVCGAKDCRAASGHAPLLRELSSARCELIDTRCLDVCTGPVVVVGVGEDRPIVLRKVRGGKARRQLLTFVAGGLFAGRLGDLEVRGKRRREAVRRVRPR